MLVRLTDEELMVRIQRYDDSAAFAVLHDRHAGIALGVARRVLHSSAAAEEAVQDAFVDLWRNRRTYAPERGSVRTLLVRIVRNRAIDGLRREDVHLRRRAADPADNDSASSPESPVAELMHSAEASRRLRLAVESLPPEQYRALDLAYFLGLSQQDIAAVTGVPLGTVKGRIRLGLRKLRDQFPADPAPTWGVEA